jgi:drug/metabolite transporter (DMT)-like permease
MLLAKAATLTTSADMALMMGAQPIFVFLFGRFLGSSDRRTWLAALGLMVGLAGVGIAFWSPGAGSGAHAMLGRAFALTVGVAYGRGRSSPARRQGRSARSER